MGLLTGRVVAAFASLALVRSLWLPSHCSPRLAIERSLRSALGRSLRLTLHLVLALGWALPAAAHERSNSYATWTLDPDGAQITLRINARELTRIPAVAIADGDGAAAGDAIMAALVGRRGGVDCSASATGDSIATAPTDGRVSFAWRIHCPVAGDFEIQSKLPELLGTPHLCFLRVRPLAGAPSEVVLHAEAATWREPRGAAPSRGWFDPFVLGLEHIASGTDHLFFLLGLIVVAVSLSEVAVVVTAFTVAHTLTLGGAALGFLQPAAAAVESLIAASIAVLAVENLTLHGAIATAPQSASRRRAWVAAAIVLAPALVAALLGFGNVPFWALAGTTLFALCYLALAERRTSSRRIRWLVAFVFGLLHGLGFAGMLMESGFSGSAVVATLLAFNLGVEAGQLVFVAALWPLLWLGRRMMGGAYAGLVIEPASLVLLAGAVAWYGTRAFS